MVGGATSIMLLPDDCLCSIFNFLWCTTDRESFGLTCHRWLNIQNLQRRSLQFPFRFSRVGPSSLSQSCTDISSFHFHRILTRFQHLEYLPLSGCTEITDAALNYLKPYGSRLQTLCLDSCLRISKYGISLVGVGCPSLTTISLYRLNIDDTGLKALANSCSALKRVNLSYCLHISDSGLSALCQGCRELQAIKISRLQGCTQTSEMDWKQSGMDLRWGLKSSAFDFVEVLPMLLLLHSQKGVRNSRSGTWHGVMRLGFVDGLPLDQTAII
ncbi:F-box/LRR-repeat protein 12 [Hibiscus syriacus]|uniref:F-box/LRR-repeat protein 12 n=1 Tax=Hibiscus syriacus TaxID=106335 RepID=A0A6A2ZV76_HIBSY|nr:F-box/LRR-repeat protein 12 [Hibiscus syriacus]